MRYLLLILATLLLASCEGGGSQASEDKAAQPANAAHREWEGEVRKSYRADGTLKSAVAYVNGERHGVARQYYADGETVFKEIAYENGIKNGMARTFYEDGALAVESPYVNGVLHGIRKRYSPNGVRVAEIPFHQNQLAAGTVEYIGTNTPYHMVPQLKVGPPEGDKLTIEVEGPCASATWYVGYALTADNILPAGATEEDGRRSGKLKDIHLPPWPRNTDIPVIARVVTSMGNPMLISTTFRY